MMSMENDSRGGVPFAKSPLAQFLMIKPLTAPSGLFISSSMLSGRRFIMQDAMTN